MRLLKYIAAFVAAGIVGLFVGSCIAAIFSGQSFGEALGKALGADMLKMLAVFIVGMAAFVLGMVLHIVVHEAGHLAMGLLAGYKFVSFRIFKWTFVKEGEKVKIRRFSVPGTAGQCLMSPPDLPAERLPVLAYNFGGVFFNILLCALFALPLIFAHGSGSLHDLMAMSCVIVIVVGVIMILMNGIPMNIGGMPNDGMNMLELGRDLRSRQSFALTLEANALVQNGKRPRDLGEKFVCDAAEVDFGQPIQVNLLHLYACILMDRGDMEKSMELHRAIIGKCNMKMMVLVSKCELASMLLMQGQTDEAAQILNKRDMAMANNLSKSMSSMQRLLFLKALRADGDPASAQAIYEHVVNNRDRYLMKGETESDIETMQEELMNLCPGFSNARQ